jgi:hypothetical protein
MVKAFRLESTTREVEGKVENRRDKGGGLMRKRPEERVAYLRLLCLPCIFFEFQYLKKKGFMGGKLSHRGSTVKHVMIGPHLAKMWGSGKDPRKTGPEIYLPHLSVEVKENNLVEINEGYHIALDQGTAESAAANAFSLAQDSIDSGKYPAGPEVTKREFGLSSKPERMDLQKVLAVSVVYMPYWIAKLETPETTRYLVYDRDGVEDESLSTLINIDPDYARMLEENVQTN